jgi:antitoxin ChpS
MELKIVRVGNSAGLVIPLAVMKALGAKRGDSFDLEMTADGLSLKLKTMQPTYTIELIAAMCDMEAPEPDGLEAWENLGSNASRDGAAMTPYDLGDIVRFSSGLGSTIEVLVLSEKQHNVMALPLVAPIVAGPVDRYAGMAVVLEDTVADGFALLNMVRNLDLQAREGKVIGSTPGGVMSEARARLLTIFGA